MTAHLLTELTIFILAVFVGLEVIAKVPTTLHTPLMSATNAIHGIVLVGAILVAGAANAPLGSILGFILVVLASLNVFGGYTVTERMLEMFRPKTQAPKPPADGALALDPDDEIVAGTTITRDGQIVHEPTRAALTGGAA